MGNVLAACMCRSTMVVTTPGNCCFKLIHTFTAVNMPQTTYLNAQKHHSWGQHLKKWQHPISVSTDLFMKCFTEIYNSNIIHCLTLIHLMEMCKSLTALFNSPLQTTCKHFKAYIRGSNIQNSHAVCERHSEIKQDWQLPSHLWKAKAKVTQWMS